jgi:hypothetical protein
MTFFNTIDETGNSLTDSKEKNRKQEDLIYSLFIWIKQPLSPSMVLTQLGLAGKNYPITSVRRAMTNLSKEGKLKKTNDYTEGQYGKREHLWELATEPIEKQQCLFNAA